MHVYNRTLTLNRKAGFTYRDLVSLGIFFGILIIIARGTSQMSLPISTIEHYAISLAPSALPEYALATVLRMFAAIIFL